MIEINIDNTGDNVEDLVIQAIKRMIRCISSDHMPGTTGTSSTIKTSAASGSVAILNMAAVTSTQNGMKFSQDLETIHSFDLGQFQVLGGTATAFKTQVWILLPVQMYYQLWLKFLKQC
jgi:hypothetical protein